MNKLAAPIFCFLISTPQSLGSAYGGEEQSPSDLGDAGLPPLRLMDVCPQRMNLEEGPRNGSRV